MSLDDDKRRVVVQLEIEKAYDMIQDAEMLATGGLGVVRLTDCIMPYFMR